MEVCNRAECGRSDSSAVPDVVKSIMRAYSDVCYYEQNKSDQHGLSVSSALLHLQMLRGSHEKRVQHVHLLAECLELLAKERGVV